MKKILIALCCISFTACAKSKDIDTTYQTELYNSYWVGTRLESIYKGEVDVDIDGRTFHFKKDSISYVKWSNEITTNKITYTKNGFIIYHTKPFYKEEFDIKTISKDKMIIVNQTNNDYQRVIHLIRVYNPIKFD